jgi:hypothetical protein
MSSKWKERLFLALALALVCSTPLLAQSAGNINFGQTETDVKGAVKTFVTIAALIVGVVGFGRAAWKFSQGENDAIQSLLAALIANGIAMIAQTFK